MLTKRIDLNLGYSCNISCRFCYYRNSVANRVKSKDLSTKQAKRWLDWFRKKGMREVDLTGGEPTIRPDIFELAAYARSIGYRTVCVITNGLRMASPEFSERLFASGVNDVLFSLHAPVADMHDSLTCVPGCFEKLACAMQNARALKNRYAVRVRSNSVVTALNFRRVSDMAELLRDRAVDRVNFIMFNPIVEAGGACDDMNAKYSDIAPYLAEMIDKYGSSFDKVTLRYMPFCIMPGYERYITNTPQIQYDLDEWDYVLRTRFRNGRMLLAGALAVGMLFHPSKRRFLSIGMDRVVHESLKWGLALKNKMKSSECRSCSYQAICDGLWREYVKVNGMSELKRFAGIKITDPACFLEQ